MLQNIKIRNFQAHKHLEIELDPHITSIIGPSDSGKSAIIRALRWLIFNRPLGDAFIKTGSKQAAVILKTENHTIKRKIGQENLYILDGEKYKAFKAGVPEEIQNILKLDEINFQNQHDSPFWFNESAGEVSRQLNQIVDLEIMDKTLTNLAGELRKARAEESVIQKRIEETSEQRQKLKHIRQMDDDLKKVESYYKEHSEITVLTDSLASIISEVRLYTESQKKHAMTAEIGEKAVSAGNIWRGCIKDVRNLKDTIAQVRDLKPEVEKEIPDISALKYMYELIEEHIKSISELKKYIERIKNAKDSLDNISRQSKKAEKEFKETIGKECPLCGQMIK